MEIIYASEEHLTGFHQALDAVAREQIHIEMIEARPLDQTAAFQKKLIRNHWPAYYAVEAGVVVGWVDIIPFENPRMSHRGPLGMGLLTEYRGKGWGSQLLSRALRHAKEMGLEKVELAVYTENLAAIRLYEKTGFTRIGVVKNYRKLNGRSFDCLEMELFL
jgi:RimJ/RimL family protein N-acetyltransferase